MHPMTSRWVDLEQSMAAPLIRPDWAQILLTLDAGLERPDCGNALSTGSSIDGFTPHANRGRILSELHDLLQFIMKLGGTLAAVGVADRRGRHKFFPGR